MATKSPFYLLEPLEVLSSPQQWLGRIVKDYQRPRDGSVPSVPAKWVKGFDEEEFADVDTLISRTTSTAFGANLVQLFGNSYERSKTSEAGVKASKVRRIRLQDPEELLRRLVEDQAIATRLEEWFGSLLAARPVYFIVGFLIAQDPVISRKTAHSHGVGGSVDPIGIATAATGVPLPVQGLEGTLDHSHSTASSTSATAPGTRIFAIEYKILKKSVRRITKIYNFESRVANRADDVTMGRATYSYISEDIDSVEGSETEEPQKDEKIETEDQVGVEPESMLDDFEWLSHSDSKFGLAQVEDASFVFASNETSQEYK